MRTGLSSLVHAINLYEDGSVKSGACDKLLRGELSD
jgi:hypothetical protein